MHRPCTTASDGPCDRAPSLVRLERHIEAARLSLALHRPWSDQWRAAMTELVSLERRRRSLATAAA